MKVIFSYDSKAFSCKILENRNLHKNVHQKETKNKNPENYFEKGGLCDEVKFILDFPALFTKN